MTEHRPALLTVAELMTAAPHCIGADQTLSLAAKRMNELRVRHLPVLMGGELLGVVSERDIALVRSVMPERLEQVTVEEAMTAVPYCVSPDAELSDVARHMARRKLGSAIVVKHGKVLGVFTTTDALHALSALLEGRRPGQAPRRTASAASRADAPPRQ
jgi:acetoin utilization protein AcuB